MNNFSMGLTKGYKEQKKESISTDIVEIINRLIIWDYQKINQQKLYNWQWERKNKEKWSILHNKVQQ